MLFIDEIHRLQNIEEYLYPAMEDFTLDIIIDHRPNARSVRLNLPRFTPSGPLPAAAAHRAVAYPVFRAGAARLLSGRGFADDCARSARLPTSRPIPMARRDCPPQPRHAANRQQPSAGCETAQVRVTAA